MAGKAIPDELRPKVIEQAGKGFTTREIRDWLLEAHGIDVNHATVARLLQKERERRAPIAQQIVREELSEHIVSDLDESRRVLEDLKAIQRRLATIEPSEHEDTAAFRIKRELAQIEALDVQRKLLADRAKMAGVTDTGAETLADLMAEVLSQ